LRVAGGIAMAGAGLLVLRERGRDDPSVGAAAPGG
jgi:hypothetical protein